MHADAHNPSPPALNPIQWRFATVTAPSSGYALVRGDVSHSPTALPNLYAHYKSGRVNYV